MIVIVACQRLHQVDKALLRPGRLHQVFHLHVPNREDLSSILSVELSKMTKVLDPTVTHRDILSLMWDTGAMDGSTGHNTNKLTGADVYGVCKRAKVLAMTDATTTLRLSPSTCLRESCLVQLHHFAVALNQSAANSNILTRESH